MTGPVLRVDLDRLAYDLATAHARIAPAELMLVVKDDAYGHGLDEVVRRAVAEGVGWFGAFDIATGLRVRGVAGDAVRIFTWIPADDADLRAAVAHDLDIGVGDSAMLDGVGRAAAEAGRRARVHLELDSGLHRGGVRAEDWPAFVGQAATLEHNALVDVVGVFSHLAEASHEDDDDAREAFDIAVDVAAAAGLAPGIRHLTASAASFARPELRYDLCRIGAFAYGIRPDGGPSDADLGIVPVATLEATVTDVTDAAVILGIGALDGVPSLLGRRLSIATPAGPRRVEHVGDHETRVVPWPGATIGDTVGIWGADAAVTATDAAELIGTIGEELAVRVSPRVPRRYP